MKRISIPIYHDRLFYGPFPKDEVLKVYNDATIETFNGQMEITIEKCDIPNGSPFTDKVTISADINDSDNELEVAYSIGSFVGTLLSSKR